MRFRRPLPMLGMGRRRRRVRVNRARWFASPSLQDLLTDLDPGWREWAISLQTAGGERRR